MTTSPRLIRLPAVESMTGLGRTAIYELEGAGKFPRRRKITARASAWLESEVAEWITSRPTAADLSSREHGGRRSPLAGPTDTMTALTTPRTKNTDAPPAGGSGSRRRTLSQSAESRHGANPGNSGVE
jgi:prophage regulatory protein